MKSSYPLLRNLLLMLFLGCQCFCCNTFAAVAEGQVTGIQSGNQITLKLLDGRQRKVKLLGIRVPSANRRSAEIAKRHINMLLAGRFVSIEYETLLPSGVILGTVLHGGSDIALRMLQAGLAEVADHRYLQPLQLRSYSETEAFARSRGMGFWRKSR
ncbi:MAG: thermonuclease family protein [Candidatus Thiodiazotropha sp.]|nr:thermonuclease family protein [Candidatus Thiodiazotropha sp.]MCM8882532.1 thermonuclease family protein [Candidatus Thiodiazotropha sp.]MCM8918720.1 thermonuclease family protein [Candidatus Thiodiazotropha sp.]